MTIARAWVIVRVNGEPFNIVSLASMDEAIQAKEIVKSAIPQANVTITDSWTDLCAVCERMPTESLQMPERYDFMSCQIVDNQIKLIEL